VTGADNQQERLASTESVNWFLAGFIEAMGRGEHREPDGLARIVTKAYAMNPNSKGKARSRPLDEVLARILRGHTSDIPASE
jgi:hypothetical protein